MTKRARYIIYAILIAFAWVSQLLYPEQMIAEPLWWTGFVLLIAIFIEVSQR